MKHNYATGEIYCGECFFEKLIEFTKLKPITEFWDDEIYPLQDKEQ